MIHDDEDEASTGRGGYVKGENRGNRNEVTMIRLDASHAASAAGTSQKMGTVIMLHGWAQNSRVFHNKTLKVAK